MTAFSSPLPTATLIASIVMCLLAPGWAWWRGSRFLSPAFGAVALSVIVTTVVATSATALQHFSLGAVVAINAAITIAGLLAARRSRMRRPTPGSSPSAPGNALGALVFAGSLVAFWPAYPTFFAASDSTAYVDSGVWLARSGTLAKHDDLGPTLTPELRDSLFDSMSQVFGAGPPYRRMPGAMMLRSRDSDTAWPAFFPVPAVWAGLSSAALGARHAGAYAPLFAALAVWALFILASRWLGVALGLFAALLSAANGASYYAARMPLSEPLAWFFAVGGLAAAAACQNERGEEHASGSDAVLAGAAFGAAIFTRVDFALFLGGALLLLPWLRGSSPARLPRAFFVALAAVALLTVIELAALPGSYIDPLTDSLRGLRLRLLMAYWNHPAAVAGATAGVAVVAASMIAWLGAVRALRVGLLLGFLIAHAMAANFLAMRAATWLSFYLGWAGLALAALGALVLYRSELPGRSLFLALLASVCLVLFYNPHVFPSLPWGSRRFVPVLIPAAILTASVGISAAWRWRRVAGLVAAAALAVSVLPGGRAVWGQRFFDGAPEQLEKFAAALPDDGVVMINRSLSAHMFGAALWLLYDRNSVAVFPDSTKAGRLEMVSVVQAFADKKPVYWITNALETPVKIPFVARQEVARVNIALPLLEQTYDRVPERRERYLTPIAIFRLTPSLDGRGAAIH
ncbi:MAG: hypothetical protein HY899_15685 [Deltaproteobacteria bacterium]|nr:hypothetical protein [Deltaproteobacteria bacterium]